MKSIKFTIKWGLLLLAMHCGLASAQIVQYGRVVEMNTGGKALPGVALTIPSVHDCQPTASDANGIFRLNFGEHKTGDVIVGLTAKKHGYEVVNHHITRDGYTLTDRDSLRIVMAPVGKIAEARARYYDLLETACVTRYDTTCAFLNQQYANNNITKPELQYWTDAAEKELQSAYLHLDDYADRLARLNDVDPDDEAQALLDQLLSGQTDAVMAHVASTCESTVLDGYLAFAGSYPMMDEGKAVAAGSYDLLNIPDDMMPDLAVLDSYSQQYESNFMAYGPRYAKCCHYLGTLFMNTNNDIMAAFCFRKALRMYELLEEMDEGNHTEQIKELQNLLKGLE